MKLSLSASKVHELKNVLVKLNKDFFLGISWRTIILKQIHLRGCLFPMIKWYYSLSYRPHSRTTTLQVLPDQGVNRDASWQKIKE
ncbi:hypothetical protein Leryth_013619 [Lithospermum erythrorhizon]|nr:hypothetical protein Leryth_013619 [Lithospermum erythrorhizon]